MKGVVTVALMGLFACGMSYSQFVDAQEPAAVSPPPPAAQPTAGNNGETQPAEAAAQTAEPSPAPAESAPDNNGGIETVVVTAQRFKQSAQDVPISLTVFNQQQLSNANVTSGTDLANFTPSLSANTRFGSDNSTFTIRGFTQDLRTTASVGVYFAEVVAPRGQNIEASGDGAGPGEFFDLENVQVLKGPQGTLFGRNTTGGAVLLVPQKPTDRFEGYTEGSTGDFGMWRGQGVLNVPVTSWFKMRFGVDTNERHGYENNIVDIGADKFADMDYTAGRVSLLFNITDQLENYTILSDVFSRNNGSPGTLFACNENSNFKVNPFYLFTGKPCQEQLSNQAAAGLNGYYNLTSTIATPISLIREYRGINTTTWQIDKDLTVKNILAYTHLHGENGQDIFGTQFHVFYDPNQSREFSLGNSLVNPDVPTTSQRTTVEELQAQGHAFDEKLEWQAGAYYERSLPDGLSGDNSSSMLSCQLSTLEGNPANFNCDDLTAGTLGGVLVTKLSTDYFNRALYSQATYNITDKLSFTGGVRYTWDKTSGYGDITRYSWFLTTPLTPKETITTPQVFSQAPTGLAEFSYKPIQDVMAYVKYARGYRQGSVNVVADPGIQTWKPEYVDSYEIGTKNTFGGPVPGRFNAAVFYNDFTNQQLQAGYISPNTGPTTAIFNAGKSKIEGVESDAYFQFFHRLTLTLAYSYLDTRLLSEADNQAEVAAAAGPLGNLSYAPIANVGDSLPYAPRNTYIVGLNYRLPLSDRFGVLEASSNFSYTDRQRAAASTASPFAMLDSRRVLNLNLNWTNMFNMPFDLSMFATNVLNDKYDTFIGGTYNTLGVESRQNGAPFMFGSRLKYNFGAYAD